MGEKGNVMPYIVEVEMIVIGSMQKHAFIGNGDYCPSLTEAMGKGGGQIPMMLEMKKINEENFIVQKCGDRDKEGNYSVHDYSNCIPANPMSDRGQLLVEVDEMDIKVVGCMDHTVDNTLESANRVYDTSGLCPTIPTGAGGGHLPKIVDVEKVPKIKVRQATEQGFVECEVGGW